MIAPSAVVKRPQPRQRAVLIRAGKAAVSDYICDQYRSKFRVSLMASVHANLARQSSECLVDLLLKCNQAVLIVQIKSLGVIYVWCGG